MQLNKKQIKSSILLNQDTDLYEIKLPGINRQFESVYYCFENVNKIYGKLCNKFGGKIFDNKLVGISSINEYFIVCFIDLNTLKSEYFFVKFFDVLEFNLKNKEYGVFIYKDFQDKTLFETNYKGENFILKIEDNYFKIENSIFGSQVFSSKINFDNINIESLNKENTNNENFISIADFFIFDDYLIRNTENNFNDFNLFLDKVFGKDNNIKINITKYNDLYYPKIKINLSVLSDKLDKIELKEFRKLLLSFFTENIVCYLIDNKNIENYFSSYFNDFTKLEFDKLDLDFNTPKNIFVFDENFENFKLDFLKLRYNLFLLKEVYKKKQNNNVGLDSLHIKVSETRLNMNYSSLKIVIKEYEKTFKKLLEIIKK